LILLISTNVQQILLPRNNPRSPLSWIDLRLVCTQWYQILSQILEGNSILTKMILADPDAVRQMGAISSDIKILPIYSNIQETTVCIDPTILAFQSDAAKFITFIQDCQTLVIDRANSAKQITIYLKAPQLTAAARPIQGGRQIVPKMSGLGIMSMFTQADWNNMFKALLGLCDRMGSKVTSPAVSFRFFRFRQAEFTQIFPLIAPIISYLAIEGHVLDFDGSKLSKCTTIQMLCPPDMNASDDSCTKFWQQLQKVTTCRTIKLRQIKLKRAPFQYYRPWLHILRYRT
jgi:hypothetical protein